MRGLSASIIGLTGQALTITRRAQSGNYNPSTGITIAPTSTAAKGSILPYESFKHMGFHKEMGIDLVQGDMIALISPLGPNGKPITAPRPNDQVSAGGATYSITAVAPHSPAGTDLLFLCSLRGSQ